MATTDTPIQKNKAMKTHNSLLKPGYPLFVEQYGEAFAEMIYRETREEFEQLIPQIPYVGGDRNPLSDNIIKSASLLALYRVMKRHDKPVEEIGEIVYRMAQAWVHTFPGWVRKLLGRYYMTGTMRSRSRQTAERSQRREYTDDFVYEVVEGNGQDFDWGVNYLECGIVKFFRAQDAVEFAPYMCQLDYVMFQGLQVGLERTMTIAQGGRFCDFRFKKGRPTPDGWPPKFLTHDINPAR